MLRGFTSVAWDLGSDGGNTHSYLSWTAVAVDENWRFVSLSAPLELVPGAHNADALGRLLRSENGFLSHIVYYYTIYRFSKKKKKTER
jgi:hypothetical protein